MTIYSHQLFFTFVALLVLGIGCDKDDDPISPDLSGAWSITFVQIGTSPTSWAATSTGNAIFQQSSFIIQTDTTWVVSDHNVYFEMVITGDAVNDTLFSGTIQLVQKAFGSDRTNATMFHFNSSRTSFHSDEYIQRDQENNAVGTFLVKGSKL
ncbi:hypothetical protein KQI65_07835 [bacterium]|nr:hypothetical protein [bacterium]